uniref:Uncharacterized protein n=1 Tax=Trichuris muris TaxID=70415 RepID=A0A5S6QFU2_TRIMR
MAAVKLAAVKLAAVKLAPVKIAAVKSAPSTAVMSLRLTETIKQETRMPIDNTVYWTDSTTVLYWLRTPARMSSFVVYRVAEIMEYSEAKDWRHVPGNLNPADDASRDVPANKLH